MINNSYKEKFTKDWNLVSEDRGRNTLDVFPNKLLRTLFQPNRSYATQKEDKYVLKIFASFALQDISVGNQNKDKMDSNVTLEQCFPTFSTSRYPWPRSSYLTVPLEENIYFFKLIYFLIISYLRDITVYCCWVSVYSLINDVKMNII